MTEYKIYFNNGGMKPFKVKAQSAQEAIEKARSRIQRNLERHQEIMAKCLKSYNLSN